MEGEGLVKSEQDHFFKGRRASFVSEVCSQANSVMFCVLLEQPGKVFQRTTLHVYVLLYIIAEITFWNEKFHKNMP